MKIAAEYIEVHIFRRINDKIEFLILKRAETESYAGIWQPITGSIIEGEKAYETAIREIKEEINVEPINFWVAPNVSSFYLPEKDCVSFVPVFAAEINANAKVQISEEHSEFRWVNFEEAQKKYAWKEQRESLNVVNEYFNNVSYLHFSELKLK